MAMAIYQRTGESNVRTEEALRQIIPSYPKILDKRVLTKLDHYSRELIDHSTLLVMGSSSAAYPINIIHRDKLELINDQQLGVKLSSSGLKGEVRDYVSLYFLVPGVGHGLRLNGILSARGKTLQIDIVGVYVHCSRAAARSKLWSSHSSTLASTPRQSVTKVSTAQEFIAESPFLMLKTVDGRARTELSPRGDQPGFVHWIAEDSLFIPERPGNKVAVSLRNIIQNAEVELLFLLPHSNMALQVRGVAHLTQESQLLDRSTVNGKRPKIGIQIEACRFTLQHVDALDQLNPWIPENQVDEKGLTRFPKVLSAHMNGEGFLGKATVPIVSGIVKHDLNNLY